MRSARSPSEKSRGTMTQKKCRPISLWMPEDLIAQIDAIAAASTRGVAGATFSRSAWMLAAIRTALSDAASPALAAHRGRLADAEARTMPAEEVQS